MSNASAILLEPEILQALKQEASRCGTDETRLANDILKQALGAPKSEGWSKEFLAFEGDPDFPDVAELRKDLLPPRDISFE